MEEKRTIPAWVTYGLLLIALSACVFGALRGEIRTIYLKAVNICLECIGIG